MESYDPMKEFWTRFFPFLFRQAPVIVFMSIVVAFMWKAIGDIKTEGKIERIEIRKECAESIADVRTELRACRNENDAFRLEIDTLRAENLVLHKRLTSIQLKFKR